MAKVPAVEDILRTTRVHNKNTKGYELLVQAAVNNITSSWI